MATIATPDGKLGAKCTFQSFWTMSSTRAVRASRAARPLRLRVNCCWIAEDPRRDISLPGKSSNVPEGGRSGFSLKGTGSTFVIADPYGIVDAREENLSVADLARTRS